MTTILSGVNANSRDTKALLICFSHLRWGFVFQRPQHLMSRFAKTHDVIYWEEPKLTNGIQPLLDLEKCSKTGVTVATPNLPEEFTEAQRQIALRSMLDTLVAGSTRQSITRWYYTPMMLPFSKHIKAETVVYDCMDELSAFKFADPKLVEAESELFACADLVFTGGQSLYQAKRDRHASVHCFPSSVDIEHFSKARNGVEEPVDQISIPGPRLGYYGVIDERVDLELIGTMAELRPDWNFVMVGPVVKIEEADLPRASNIHWLGGKTYDELPAYLSGWDVALMPFAINESTRFISPTKTPEYLAGGKVVVSTPIVDVEAGYGKCPRVCIADSAEGFVAACETAMIFTKTGEGEKVADAMLAAMSWDDTQRSMAVLIAESAKGAAVQSLPTSAKWPKPKAKHYDWLIVGAGFAGSVMAERLAAGSGQKVLVVDRRPHIAGNAFDERNNVGQLYHKYGPHLFHTNSADVFEYLSRFTKWRNYEHRVLASVDGQLVPIPINRTTINALYDAGLETDAEAEAWLESRAEPVDVVETSEDVVISAIGRELYEKFFRGYTRKQWGLDPSELDKSVTARVPTRTNTDDRYFTDRFQAIPADGYTKMFENMLDHPNIDVLLDVDYADIRNTYSHDKLVFTGPIDEYFGYCFGALPYRSLRFDHAVVEQEQYQPVATVNYPDEAIPYTRITEYKHFTGDTGPVTSITTEYPTAEGDPYYPIPREENQRLYKRYEMLAQNEKDTVFVGRLATYKYYNMDQVVGQALAIWRKRIAPAQDLEAVQNDNRAYA